MNHELKIRAKRLRLAISELLGLEIKMSQSLELVAREENYPNWDAASACAGRTSRAT
ncbi:glyoxalase superfamily protein, partial [Pseudomonas aeruginosa]